MHRYRNRFTKPRDVRSLSHVTMSDNELTQFIRLKQLRAATDRIRTQALSDDEWHALLHELGMIVSREPRP